jgi:transposase
MIPPLTITNERVDDIPLLLRQMTHMGVGELLDKHFETHGNWQGASLGTVSEVWLSHILSEGDHRLSYVEDWVADRPVTLSASLNQEIRRLDFSDDRLADVLRLLSDDERWSAFESELNQRLVRVYELRPSQVRLDSTTVSGQGSVTEDGLFQYGHSKDHRPDLPQLKVMMATLDSMGMPLVTSVVDGSRADDPLYLPTVAAIRESLGQSGLLYVGDSKMAALATRGTLTAADDYYLCPLPQVQLPPEGLQSYLEPVWRQEQTLSPIERVRFDGKRIHIAHGFEVTCHLSAEIAGQLIEWPERRLVVCSFKQAEQQKQGLEQRLAKAQQAIAELNVAKQGRRRLETQVQWQQQVETILKQGRVEDLLEVTYDITTQQRRIRPYRDRPERLETKQQIKVKTALKHSAVENVSRYFGWRVYATNAPETDLPLEKAVLAYREQYTQERSFGRFKNKPLSLSPMYLHRDDHATGLVRLLSIGLRAVTLIEFSMREKLAQENSALVGLYPGNPNRTTTRPTTERLLRAFDNITLTIIAQEQQKISYITSLSPLQQRILSLLGFSADIYSRFNSAFQKPP